MCFRYSDAAVADKTGLTIYTGENKLASVGVISATVMYDSKNAATKFNVAPIAGWFKDASNYNDGKIVIPLIRV